MDEVNWYYNPKSGRVFSCDDKRTVTKKRKVKDDTAKGGYSFPKEKIVIPHYANGYAKRHGGVRIPPPPPGTGWKYDGESGQWIGGTSYPPPASMNGETSEPTAPVEPEPIGTEVIPPSGKPAKG